MSIADGLVLDGAQAEALGGIVGRLFQASVVEHQHFRLPIFEEELAVVGAVECALQMPPDLRLIETGTVEEGSRRGTGHHCDSGSEDVTGKIGAWRHPCEG